MDKMKGRIIVGEPDAGRLLFLAVSTKGGRIER